MLSVDDWLEMEGRKGPIGAFVAQNDDMAMGTRQAVRDAIARWALPLATVPIIGCDGSPRFGQRLVREHRLACPRNDQGIVFTNSRGGIEHRNTIVEHGFHPAQVAAGVVDQNGGAKYKGLHALRHFYASWCINRRVDGGLELPLKVVQARLGHASIQMTADTYGHLFPRGDDGSELAQAERALLG